MTTAHVTSLDIGGDRLLKRKNEKFFFNKIQKRKISQNKNNDQSDSVNNNEFSEEYQVKNTTSNTESDEKGISKENVGKSIGFTLVKQQESHKIRSVKHHLPSWLANPQLITTDLKNLDFTIEEATDLEQSLVLKLQMNNIHHFFPVQKAVIPWLLLDVCKYKLHTSKPFRPRDLCVSAPTGSGKTLAYVLPIIQCLSKRLVPKIRALVVVPVQDLAIQIADVFRIYCKGTQLRVESAVGGTPLKIEQGKLIKHVNSFGNAYECLIDILVITPGRLVEHLDHTDGFDLSDLHFLVMDEADRMINNMQNNWYYHLEKHINSHGTKQINQLSLNAVTQRKSYPQKLLFSATLSQDPEKLKSLNLFQPILFSTTSNGTIPNNLNKTEDYIGAFKIPSELKEKYIVTEMSVKPLVICLLLQKAWRNILCFTKSTDDAHRLSNLLSILNPNKNVTEISSRLPRDQRDKILKDFSSGLIDVLVCSDLIGRGIDIPSVKYVISYDAPKHIETYIHRVGRTGRAGTKGVAVTLLTSSQVAVFNRVLSDANINNLQVMKVDEGELTKLIPNLKEGLRTLKALLEKEKVTLGQKTRKEKFLGKMKMKNKCNIDDT